MNHVASGLAVAIAALSTGVSANGFPEERAAGGVVPRHSTTIAMKSEDLYLSREEVRVRYVFAAASGTPERVRMAFPLPAIAPGASIGNGLESEVNYLRFSVQVEGRPVQPSVRLIATRQPQAHRAAPPQPEDVTARLRLAGLGPDFRSEATQAALRTLPKDVAQRLRSEGLVSFEDDPAEASAAWRLQTVFEWEQDFAPGETRVEIRYVPLTGGQEGDADEWFTAENRRRYCADGGLMAAARRWEKTSNTAPVTLTYIVTTARYWNGPIGRFRLTVDKGSPRALASSARRTPGRSPRRRSRGKRRTSFRPGIYR